MLQRMKTLIAKLTEADLAYYKTDAPIMTDQDYDLLYDELAHLESHISPGILWIRGNFRPLVSCKIFFVFKAYTWTSLTPYDGLNFSLHCDENLVVKQYRLFDNGQGYTVELEENKKNICISSTEWLNSFTGLSIIVAESKS